MESRVLGMGVVAAAFSVLLLGCSPKERAGASTASDSSRSPPDAVAPSAPQAPAGTGSVGAQASNDAPLRPTGTTENDPKDQTMAFLYYSVAGQTPPLEDWAEQDARQKTSDEFARKKKAAELLETYKAKFADAGKIGRLVIPVNAQLSEYDDKAGEFYVDAFSPSRFFQFNYDGLTIRTEFVNGDKAQHWRMGPDEAAATFKTNNSSHGVVLTIRADIVGAKMDDNIAILRLRVSDYDIATAYGGRRLGQVTLEK